MADKKIIAYKGFDKDLKCRDFQYEIGKEYIHKGKVEPCQSGFHACEYPLDVFQYYNPAGSRFAEVEASGEIIPQEDKICCEKIKIKTELTLGALIQAAVKFTFDRVKCTKENHVEKEKEAASATGNWGAASATGDCGAASATGDCGAASATGNWGAASATGDWGAASATGNCGAASATGNWGAASATGNCGAASATGYRGAASATGKESIACGLGFRCKAKGAKGCWLVIAERDDYGRILLVRTVKVDGKDIKADTWYTLQDGQFVEAKV